MKKRFLLMLITLVVLPMNQLFSSETFDGASLLKVEAISQGDNNTQLLFFFDSAVKTPSSFQMKSPNLVVLDFENVKSLLGIRKTLIQSPFVKSVRTARGNGKLRVMVALKQAAQHKVLVSGANVYVSFSKAQKKTVNEKSNFHYHAERSHNHSLPTVGVQHRHGDGPVGQQVQFYKITGVKSQDSLNIRSMPNAMAAIIGEIPSNGKGITSNGEDRQNGRATFIKISYKGVSGWVSKRYLQIDS